MKQARRSTPARGSAARGERAGAAAAQMCGSASLILPLGLALPYAWRLAQCLRVYRDTGARPQLFNALKYSTAFPVILFSALKYQARRRPNPNAVLTLCCQARRIPSSYSRAKYQARRPAARVRVGCSAETGLPSAPARQVGGGPGPVQEDKGSHMARGQGCHVCVCRVPSRPLRVGQPNLPRPARAPALRHAHLPIIRRGQRTQRSRSRLQRPGAAQTRRAGSPGCARSRRPRHSLLRRCLNLGARAQVTPGAWAGVYKPLWLAAALLNSGYSYFWDLERDWEIQAFTGPPSGAPSTPPRLPPPPCSPSNMCTKQFMQRGRQLLFCGWGGRCSGNRAWQGQRVALARLPAPVDRC